MQLTKRKIVWLQQVHSDKTGCMNDIKAYEQSCIAANTYLISSKNSASLIRLTQQIFSICQFFVAALDVLAIVVVRYRLQCCTCILQDADVAKAANTFTDRNLCATYFKYYL